MEKGAENVFSAPFSFIHSGRLLNLEQVTPDHFECTRVCGVPHEQALETPRRVQRLVERSRRTNQRRL
jgi:hypothetical protein